MGQLNLQPSDKLYVKVSRSVFGDLELSILQAFLDSVDVPIWLAENLAFIEVDTDDLNI